MLHGATLPQAELVAALQACLRARLFPGESAVQRGQEGAVTVKRAQPEDIMPRAIGRVVEGAPRGACRSALFHILYL